MKFSIIKNIFMSGDWIVNRHGSWSQEKAYVIGLEAANLMINHFRWGNPAPVLPVEADEPHIQAARILNQRMRAWRKAF